MTARDRMRDSGDCGADAAAYVLGALEPEEAARFRAHLDGCVICRDEVATLQATADALPMTAPQVALPNRVRRRIAKQARRERRAPDSPRHRAVTPRWRGAVVLAGSLAVAAFATAELAGGGSSPSTRVITAHVAGVGGSAYLSVRDGHAELVVAHMAAPPAGKIYEVWLKRPSGAPKPTSALFDVTSGGAGSVDVPGDLRGISQVLVTPEPLGGSLVPTHAPVIEASL